MSKFYDAKDESDLARVEDVLKKGGIEYTVAACPQGTGIAREIEVAEEDLPFAEKLLGVRSELEDLRR